MILLPVRLEGKQPENSGQRVITSSPDQNSTAFFRIVFEVIHEPMFILLVTRGSQHRTSPARSVLPVPISVSPAPGRGFNELQVRILTFTTIVIANLGMILTNRSWSQTIFETFRIPNRALAGGFAGTLRCLFLVLYVPALRDLFRFAPVLFIDIIMCAGMLSIIWFEISKYWSRERGNGA